MPSSINPTGPSTKDTAVAYNLAPTRPLTLLPGNSAAINLTPSHTPPAYTLTSPSCKILPLVPGCSHQNCYIPPGYSHGCGTGAWPGLLGLRTWNKLVFIPNKSINPVASLGRCIFVGHNNTLGHAQALLPFHTVMSPLTR